MDFSAITGDAGKRKTACAIVGVYERKVLGFGADEIDAASGGLISGMLDQGDISCKLGSAILLSRVDGAKCKRVVVVGLGRKSSFGRREYAKAVQAGLSAIKSSQVTEAACYLSGENTVNADAYYRGRLAAQALGAHRYRFNELKSKNKPAAPKLRKLALAAANKADGSELARGAEHGHGIAVGMHFTRDLANMPPNICHPTYLADEARALASNNSKLKIKVLDEPDMAALGMNSLLSVGHGSEQPSKLIQLDYRAGGDEDPIILVGKGITFDTGGISLKPGPMMDEMKFDMGGAAGVLGTMAAVSHLKLPINLTVIVPSAENMPSGRASRPGDIVESMSGKTIEILNTDAEGRLILCDALTYAQQFSPRALIDVATLTGACVIALGHHRSGVMGNDQALISRLLDAGERAVDRAWQLPIDQEYADQLKSNFADYANIGGREGGAITAAAFLGQFTEDVSWAHVDIAGTAWVGGAKKGASGRPVPMLVDYLLADLDSRQ
ncbi:MAG: leucyl aminopeptidase [Pseudomonadota bacterium]